MTTTGQMLMLISPSGRQLFCGFWSKE